MRGERGQATVEWVGIVLLVAVALASLARLSPRADGQRLGTTLARSVAHPVPRAGPRRETPPPPRPAPAPPARREAFMVPPLVPLQAEPRARPRPRIRLPALRPPWVALPGRAPALPPRPSTLLRRARRGAGLAWRRAWFACLAYERARWAVLHPESRFPGYTMPPEEVLRIANDCVSPVDLVRDWPLLRGR